MAENTIKISPGVFTQERDQSFLAQGVAEIGAAFVGPTTKGPAFVPTSVIGNNGFVTTFGEPDGNSYMGYAVQNYLQEAGSATIVRVLGLGGYTTKVAHVYASGSAGQKLLAVLHPTVSGSGTSDAGVASVLVAGTTASFSLVVSSSNAVGPHISASNLTAVEGDTSFIGTVFGGGANSGLPAYTYAIFPSAVAQAGPFTTTPHFTAFTASLDFTTSAAVRQYKNATTPWIKSQPIGGTTSNLFKVHTLSDGNSSNGEIKVSIANVSPTADTTITEYGTFSLLVRDFGDTDNSIVILEQYDNLTLDPNSPDYIGLRIGTQYTVYDTVSLVTQYEGEYPNRSNYIRVEIADDIAPNALPYGFEALKSVTAPVGAAQSVTSGSYVLSRWLSGSTPGYQAGAASDRGYYYGYNVADTTSNSYIAPINGTTSVGSDFNISGSVLTTEVEGSAIDLYNKAHRSYRRFTVPFQGGFDGFKPNREITLGGAITATNTQGFNLATNATSGSVEYKRALNALSNPDSVDFNLLIVPGAIHRLHAPVTQTAMDLCASRGDAFYIMDATALNDSVTDAVNTAASLDTNYAAVYYPWVKVVDTNSNRQIWAPPSVVLPEVYAYSDNVGAEWFAPAGLNRGGIPGAVGVKTRLTQAQRDDLYTGKINPIAQFPGQGICVWGQKTLQTRSSALDRVNVRRLLIAVKKFIASSARYLVFEQNIEATRNRFLNIVNPYLAGIQQNSGLTAFRVVMDETNNTPDVIDRNILYGQLYLQPTKTAEFIILDFNVLPTGATFPTA